MPLKKQIKRLLILPLVILLINPMKSLASESEIDLEIKDLEKIIIQGEKKSVLVPESNYRYYQSKVYQDKVLEDALKECIQSTEQFDPKIPFAGGIFIGVLATSLIFIAAKH